LGRQKLVSEGASAPTMQNERQGILEQTAKVSKRWAHLKEKRRNMTLKKKTPSVILKEVTY
jgi:hypothetical protein